MPQWWNKDEQRYPMHYLATLFIYWRLRKRHPNLQGYPYSHNRSCTHELATTFKRNGNCNQLHWACTRVILTGWHFSCGEPHAQDLWFPKRGGHSFEAYHEMIYVGCPCISDWR